MHAVLGAHCNEAVYKGLVIRFQTHIPNDKAHDAFLKICQHIAPFCVVVILVSGQNRDAGGQHIIAIVRIRPDIHGCELGLGVQVIIGRRVLDAQDQRTAAGVICDRDILVIAIGVEFVKILFVDFLN